MSRPALLESHLGAHWCNLDPYDCLGEQFRQQKPRLIRSIEENIAHHEEIIRRERLRLEALRS